MSTSIINYPPLYPATAAGPSPVLVQVNRSSPLLVSQMRVGWTCTQRGLGSAISSGGGTGTIGASSNVTVDGDAGALSNAVALLGGLAIASQHAGDFGGGVFWPDPTVALDYTQPFLDSVNAPNWYALDYRVNQMRQTKCQLMLVAHRLAPPWMTVKTPSGTPGNAASWMSNTPCIAAATSGGAYGAPYVGAYPGPYTDTISISAPPGYTGALDGNSLCAYMWAQAARRYPDVLLWVVGNEMNNKLKGYSCYISSSTLNPTNAAWTGSGTISFSDLQLMMTAYTATYNAVYAALKAVNPLIQVGGPYYTMGAVGSNNDRSLLAQFFDGCTGLDFVAVDGTNALTYSSSSPPANSTDQLDATVNLYTKYTDIISNVRDAGGASAPTHPKAYGKPVVAMEYYLDTNTGTTDYANKSHFPTTTITTNFVTHEYNGVGLTSLLGHMTRAGVSAAIRWQAESTYEQFPSDGRYGRCGNQQGYISQVSTTQGGLNTALYPTAWKYYGGQPFPAHWGALWIQQHFNYGTQLYSNTVTDPANPATPRVEILASATRTLLLNKWSTSQSIGVSYNGGSTYTYYTLPAYGMALVA